MMALDGFEIVENELMVEVVQVRFPRSRRRRIRKKWAGRACNRAVRPMDTALVDFGRGRVYCHPSFAVYLREQLERARAEVGEREMANLGAAVAERLRPWLLDQVEGVVAARGGTARCPHCGDPVVFSEDRGAHCDGCDEYGIEDVGGES